MTGTQRLIVTWFSGFMIEAFVVGTLVLVFGLPGYSLWLAGFRMAFVLILVAMEASVRRRKETR